MKIALNAVAFVPGTMGGVETYFRNLVASLQQGNGSDSYYVICAKRWVDSLELANPRFSALACGFAKPSALWYLRAGIRALTPFDPLRGFVDRLQADLIHHPFSILQPIGHRLPSVLTFHDMQHEFFPEYFPAGALRARRSLWRPSAERATRIIAISQHAKTSLIERYQIDPAKIDVVHVGYSSRFRVIEDAGLVAEVRSRYGLHRPFMYYPAATWPHKNHKRLLAALRLLKDRYRFEGQLVLSGIAMQAHGEILAEVARLGLGEDVMLLGYLPEHVLPVLYNMARLLVFPSRFEGFGIPLLEAMACGCPVACSNAASIPEVIGPAGTFFDPCSVEEMAQAVESLWSDTALRQGAVARGLQRVRQFSWEKMARETVEVYRKTLRG